MKKILDIIKFPRISWVKVLIDAPRVKSSSSKSVLKFRILYIEINIRVDEKEKKKLQRNAKKSGLSLSAYLRKSGLNQEIYEIPNEKLGEVYKLICQIKDNLYKIELERIDKGLAQVKEKFLEVFNPIRDGGSNGNN